MAARGVIRRLWSGERDQIRDHLLRLDGDDRVLRFGGYASDAHIAGYGERLDWSRLLVVGYVTGGEVRGLGQLEPIGAGWPRAAELAVSVERLFQSRGIGTALLRRLVIAARNRLIERVHMVCLMDNGRAVRMARRLDGALHFHDGAAEARIEPPWPTPWTWLEETLFEPALTGIDHARWQTLRYPLLPENIHLPADRGSRCSLR
jgi:ribosomal protein S18 acetylase RimI-like enzyme